jgi:hypothetical protein
VALTELARGGAVRPSPDVFKARKNPIFDILGLGFYYISESKIISTTI